MSTTSDADEPEDELDEADDSELRDRTDRPPSALAPLGGGDDRLLLLQLTTFVVAVDADVAGESNSIRLTTLLRFPAPSLIDDGNCFRCTEPFDADDAGVITMTSLCTAGSGDGVVTTMKGTVGVVLIGDESGDCSENITRLSIPTGLGV